MWNGVKPMLFCLRFRQTSIFRSYFIGVGCAKLWWVSCSPERRGKHLGLVTFSRHVSWNSVQTGTSHTAGFYVSHFVTCFCSSLACAVLARYGSKGKRYDTNPARCVTALRRRVLCCTGSGVKEVFFTPDPARHSTRRRSFRRTLTPMSHLRFCRLTRDYDARQSRIE